ncbi:MAG: hypothetical protein MUO54_01500 [Anaerolineales bacterium]|nr:hypothetical protein [Anaerolineales bacterium]
MTEWKLQKKLVQFIKSWPILIAVFLGSGLISWGAVHLFPPLQQATADLYIGIDITRVYDVSSVATYTIAEPFNVDDYKNWQLSQVNSIAISERIANLTLEKLQILDPYWEDLSVTEFQEMQDLYWYDVGTWRLQYQSPETDHALQAVQTWREIIQQDLSRLIRESEDVLEFEGSMRALNTTISQLETRMVELEILVEQITAIQEELKNAGSLQVMDDSTREEIWLSIAGATVEGVLWEQILDEFPERDQPNQEFILWMDQVLAAAESDRERYLAIMQEHISEHEMLTEDYIREIREAEGLSASLFIGEELPQPKIVKTYPDTQIAFLGSFVGLLIYVIVWVMYSERQREND